MKWKYVAVTKYQSYKRGPFRYRWEKGYFIQTLADCLDDAIKEIRADPLLKDSSFDIWRFPGSNLVYVQ
jgi:hypothetical protein